ncbi:CD40 ligand [Varanus komodoensis]|uniref:CD40 ligand n=1 Tax=Varanus komodoensis TaxID=61221 RepID=UPI001CF7EC9C|nr:CD40 ligand [Varanus komodoensis]
MDLSEPYSPDTTRPARVPVTMKAFLSLISLFVVVQLIGTALFGLYLHMKLDKVGDELNLQEDVVFLRRLQKCRKSQDPDTTLLDCTKILKTFNDLQDVSSKVPQESPFAMQKGDKIPPAAIHLAGLKDSKKVLQWQKAIYAPMDDTFSYQDGNLKVTKSGRYFIYSQVAFCSNMLPHVPFSVYVYLNLPFQVDQLLLKGVGTHGTSGDLCGLQSIHLGRTAELQQGHTIFVNVTDSSRVNYNHENTYFGVFQLS